MTRKFTAEEDELIGENVEYALGLYDLYPDDKVIIDSLRMKGLNYRVIEGILFEVKKPSYLKRIKQGKMHILWGAILLASLTVIRFLLIKIPGSENLLNKREFGDEMLIYTFKFYREIFYLIMILSGLRIILGIKMQIKYKRLLGKEQ